jgi:hypothetical protein
LLRTLSGVGKNLTANATRLLRSFNAAAGGRAMVDLIRWGSKEDCGARRLDSYAAGAMADQTQRARRSAGKKKPPTARGLGVQRSYN